MSQQLPVLAAVAAAAAMASVPALAQSDAAPTQRVEIAAPALSPSVTLHPGEYSFKMETGRTLVVTPTGNALSMRYGRHIGRILQPTGDGAFVSADGQISLQVLAAADGDPQRVRLSLPANLL